MLAGTICLYIPASRPNDIFGFKIISWSFFAASIVALFFVIREFGTGRPRKVEAGKIYRTINVISREFALLQEWQVRNTHINAETGMETVVLQGEYNPTFFYSLPSSLDLNLECGAVFTVSDYRVGKRYPGNDKVLVFHTTSRKKQLTLTNVI